MTPEDIQNIARQLACPSGEDGDTISEKMNRMNGFITARCLEALNPSSGQAIIEIGPGNGALSEPLVDLLGSCGTYHAIERSPDMAAITHNRLTARNAAAVRVHCGDCDDAPIATRSLDGAFAVNLLYFIPDLEGFFGTLQHWLKPSGRAVFGVRSSLALKAMPFTKFGFHIRGLDKIIATFNAAGFINISANYHDEGSVDFDGIDMPMDSLIISGSTAPLEARL